GFGFGGVGVVGGPGQAQVGELGHPGGREDDVFGFDVAVNQVAGVGVNQGFANLDGDVEGFAFGEDFAPPQRRRLHQVVHRLALNVFHDEVVVAFGGDVDIDGLNDVVVGEAGGGFSFLIK